MSDESFRDEIDVRPRTTGEIMDDAWRLYFADIPALLLLSGIFFCLPGLTVWAGSAPVHAFLAAKEGRLFQAFQAAGRESQRQPGKVLALTLGRGALLIFAVLNLHMVVLFGVWVGENLAGFDWSALAAGLSLLHNPTY